LKWLTEVQLSITERWINFPTRIAMKLNDDTSAMVNVLASALSSSNNIDPSMGFMIDSLKELLKALRHCPKRDECAKMIDQYAQHVVNYVQFKTGVLDSNKSKRSLITTVGPDLSRKILLSAIWTNFQI
jgi:hypothetical protein